MDKMTVSFLFIKALLAHVDRLQVLLGDMWHAFQERLEPLLRKLVEAEDENLVSELVDQIYEIGLDSSAGNLVRALRRKALTESKNIDRTKHPVRIIDPHTGQPLYLKGSTPVKGDAPAARKDDVIGAVRALGQVIFPMEEATVSGPEQRYFNAFFTQPDSGLVISPDQPLVHNQAYNLYLDISLEQKGLGEEDVLFPDEVLTEVWEDQDTLLLTVWVASHDFKIDPQLQTLHLPRQGSSDGLRFRVIPLLKEDWGFIQVELFYQGHLMQSKRVEAFVVPTVDVTAPAGVHPVQTARITFTATTRLDPENLARFPERVLTIDVERDQRDGSVDFRFLDRTHGDERLTYYDTRLQPEALGNAIAKIRNQLKLAVIGEEHAEGYLWKLKGDDTLLTRWLPRLALVGHEFYRILLPKDGENDNGERVWTVLQPGTVIQVNPVVGTVTIPWALLYEREIKYVPGRTRHCEGFIDCSPDCAGCPSADDPYVVCPFAFWGYRYAIEQLPCWISGELPRLPTLVSKIDNSRPLQLNLNVWRDFNFWKDHLEKIKQYGEVQVLVAEETQQMEQIWENNSTSLDVVYFYCHGGIDGLLGPYLKLSDAAINSAFLEASNLNWPKSPLVFLNGCATGDYGPDSYISLINDFRTAGACGVIGTECAVPELFAETYAAELFPRLFRGEQLGQAMLNVRLDFLCKNKNPLGLAYTLYAAHEVALARPVANN